MRIFPAACCAALLMFSDLPAQELSRLGGVAPFGMQGSVGASIVGNTISGIDRRKSPFS